MSISIERPFSDVDWVRRDLPSVSSDDRSDAEVRDDIEDGDREVMDDLNNYVDLAEIETVPEAMKRLSHYKACELVLLRVINDAAVVDEENNLVAYWAKKYDKLLKDVRSGEVRLLDDAGEPLEPDEHPKADVRIGRIV
jgi:hypothetical protein